MSLQQGMFGLLMGQQSSAPTGLIIEGAEQAWGSFTPESNITSAYTIAHGMSGAPDFAIVFAVPRPGSNSATLLRYSAGDNLDGNGDAQTESGNVAFNPSTGALTGSSTGDHRRMTVTDQSLIIGASSQMYLEAGITYYWLAYRMEDNS